MNMLALIAITWIGKEYRFLGLDWSYLMVLGFIGNALFSMRFIVQWLASERQGESVIPVSFWYWSIAGSALMCIYFIFRRDPVGILAYLPNSLIYIRNLMLIRKRKFAFSFTHIKKYHFSTMVNSVREKIKFCHYIINPVYTKTYSNTRYIWHTK